MSDKKRGVRAMFRPVPLRTNGPGGGGGGGPVDQGLELSLTASPGWVIATATPPTQVTLTAVADYYAAVGVRHLTGNVSWSVTFQPQTGPVQNVTPSGTDPLQRTFTADKGLGVYSATFTIDAPEAEGQAAYASVQAYPLAERHQSTGYVNRIIVATPEDQVPAAASMNVLVGLDSEPTRLLGISVGSDPLSDAMIRLIEHAYFAHHKIRIDFDSYTGVQNSVIVGIAFEPQ